MKERGILFSAPMVLAVLDGSKTKTRRLLKPQPVATLPNTRLLDHWPDGTPLDIHHPKGKRWKNTFVADKEAGIFEELLAKHCPYGVVGDRLWVRETWRPITLNGKRDGSGDQCFIARYAADGKESRWFEDTEVGDWYPPKAAARGNVPGIHMPRWASRLTLEITNVRVERLQDISEEDAKAEGVTTESQHGTLNGEPATLQPMTHRQAFVWLWDSINGKRVPWSSNPWVWVVSFRRITP